MPTIAKRIVKHLLRFTFRGQPSTCERHHQQPMKNPNREIPNQDRLFVFSGIYLAGILKLSSLITEVAAWFRPCIAGVKACL